MKLKIVFSKIKTIDFLVGIVIISSIALRNYRFLLYVIQAIFLIISIRYLLKSSHKGYIISKGLFLFMAIVSILWAKDATVTMKVIPSILQIYIICCIFSGYLKDKVRIEKFIYMMVIASIFLVINLVITTPINEWKMIILYSQSSYVDVASSQGRLGKGIGMHPNALGAVMAICFVCTVYQFYKTKKKRYFLWNIVLAALLLLSKSRSALIEAIVATIFIYILEQRNNIKKIKSLCYGGIIFILLSWAVLNVPFLYKVIGYRMEGLINFFDTNTSQMADASTTTRLDFIFIGIELFFKNPIVGVGMNNFSVIAYNQYNIWAEVYSHCNYVEILACLGIIGFVLYYIVFINSIIKLIRLRKKCKTQDDEIYKLVSFIIAIAGMFLIMEFTHITYDNECIQYMQLLIICASTNLKKEFLKNNTEKKGEILDLSI